MAKRLAVVVLAALALIGCGRGCVNYSDGVRIGTITKFSRKGLACKTWEGEMALGGYRSTEHGVVANLWEFSVDRPELVEAVQAAQKNGTRVEVTYNQAILGGPCYADSEYYVQAVRVLD